MTPSFSAVVPTHNRRALAERAVASILDQRFAAAEIIVVDDGSTDDTAAVLGCRDEVTFIGQSNAGAAAARNTGWRAARHPWVAFLDSDDEWRPGHLAGIAAAIEATAGVGDVYFADLVHDDGRGHWEWAGFGVDGAHEVLADATAWGCAARQPTMIQASVVRRSALDRVGGLAEWLWTREDTHLFVQLLAGHPAVAVGHVATDMSGDADAAARIGHDAGRHDPDRARRYWECTASMYRDLLDRRIVEGEWARVLERRLAGAHVRLARQGLTRRPLAALGHGYRAARIDPAGMLERLRGRT